MSNETPSLKPTPFIDSFRWCQYFIKAAYSITACIILAHVIWFFAARSILAWPVEVYLRDFIILPAIGLFALVIFFDKLVRSPKVSLVAKEYISLSLFIVFSFYLCLTHPIAKVLFGSFILTIFASTIFNNLKLTRWMYWISNVVVLFLGIIYRLNGTLNADMVMQIFVAWFMFICSFLTAKILIQNLENNLANLTIFDETQQLMQAQLKLDPFTGLNNRKTFDESLKKRIKESKATGTPLSLVMIDIDHFKNVNDDLGHAAGDRVLLYLSQKLKDVQTELVHAYRIGGDEFALTLQNTEPTEVARICENLRLQMLDFTLRATDGDPSSISCGIAMLSMKIPNSESLVRAADAALYAAKNNGRDQVVIHTDSI